MAGGGTRARRKEGQRQATLVHTYTVVAANSAGRPGATPPQFLTAQSALVRPSGKHPAGQEGRYIPPAQRS